MAEAKLDDLGTGLLGRHPERDAGCSALGARGWEVLAHFTSQLSGFEGSSTGLDLVSGIFAVSDIPELRPALHSPLCLWVPCLPTSERRISP